MIQEMVGFTTWEVPRIGKERDPFQILEIENYHYHKNCKNVNN